MPKNIENKIKTHLIIEHAVIEYAMIEQLVNGEKYEEAQFWHTTRAQQ